MDVEIAESPPRRAHARSFEPPRGNARLGRPPGAPSTSLLLALMVLAACAQPRLDVGGAVTSAVVDPLVEEALPDSVDTSVRGLAPLLIHSAFTLDPPEGTAETRAYRPGEYTVFRSNWVGAQEPGRLSRGLLHRTEAGVEAWRIVYVRSDGEGIAIEFLLAPDGRSFRGLLRLQPEGEVRRVEGEVMPGVGRMGEPEKVTTGRVHLPAGTFSATRLAYGEQGPGVRRCWWLADGVPGGTVRYLRQVPEERLGGGDPGRQRTWTAELVAYGTGVESELGLSIP